MERQNDGVTERRNHVKHVTDLTANDNKPPRADKICDKEDLDQRSNRFHLVWRLNFPP